MPQAGRPSRGFGTLWRFSGHTQTTTTYPHPAQPTIEQPLPCQPNFPESSCLVSRSSTLQEHGFNAEVAERIAAPQRLSGGLKEPRYK